MIAHLLKMKLIGIALVLEVLLLVPSKEIAAKKKKLRYAPSPESFFYKSYACYDSLLVD
jgi:hypothetical protein